MKNDDARWYVFTQFYLQNYSEIQKQKILLLLKLLVFSLHYEVFYEMTSRKTVW